MNRRCVIFLFALLSGLLQVSADRPFKEKLSRLGNRIDSVLTKRYWRADIDTNYVIRPQTKWTILGRFKLSGARISAEGQKDGILYASKMKADYKSTVSVGVSYVGLTLNLSINPAKWFGKYHDYELGFRSYGRRFGFDITYQNAHNFKGWYDWKGEHREVTTTSEDVFKLRTLTVNGYYVFNRRRFSYPAAFSHSYIQRRSAGSFLLAASLQAQDGNSNAPDDQSSAFKMTNIGIGGGYGYNFVPARGWLLHISALPTFIFFSKSSITIDETKYRLHYKFPEVIITGRGSIVKQIGRNKFAGLSMVYTYSHIGDKKSLAVDNQKWFAQLYFGFRL